MIKTAVEKYDIGLVSSPYHLQVSKSAGKYLEEMYKELPLVRFRFCQGVYQMVNGK